MISSQDVLHSKGIPIPSTPKSSGTIKKKSSIPIWFWIGLVPTFLSAAVALFAPLDVLDRIPLLMSGVDFLVEVIPAMRGYVGRSNFAQVTGATFVVAWFLFPLQLSYVVYSFMRYLELDLPKLRTGKIGRTRALIIFFLCASVVASSMLFLSKDPGIAGGLGLARSRLGLAFFGAGQFYMFSVMSAGFLVFLIKTRRGDF